MSLYLQETQELFRVRRRSPKAVIKHKLIDKANRDDLLLFHHRLPTSTPNIKKCNHPLANEDKTIHLIHNGCLSSPGFHYRRLRAKGHRFETKISRSLAASTTFSYYGLESDSFTDSEVIVHELEEHMKTHDWVRAVEKTVEALCGSLTFAFLRKGTPDILLYRGSQPCSVYTDRKGNVWFSSEYPSKLKGFKLIKQLIEGEIGSISAHGYESRKVVPIRRPYNPRGIGGLQTGSTVPWWRREEGTEEDLAYPKALGYPNDDAWIWKR